MRKFLQFSFRGHRGCVTTVHWSPDGKRIMTGGDDNTVRVWDAKEGRRLFTLTKEDARIQSVAWSLDGKRAVVGIGNGLVKIWDVDQKRLVLSNEETSLKSTKKKIGTEKQKRLSDSPVRSVAWSPDNKLIAYCTGAGVGYLFKATGRCVLVIGNCFAYNCRSCFNKDSTKILVINYNGTDVMVLEVASETVLLKYKVHRGFVDNAAFSPSGTRIVTGGHDGVVRVCDAESGAEIATMRGHTDWVNVVTWSPDGNYVVSGSEDGTIRLWSADTGVEILKLVSSFLLPVLDISFDPSGRRIAAVGAGSAVRVWHIPCQEEQAFLLAIKSAESRKSKTAIKTAYGTWLAEKGLID